MDCPQTLFVEVAYKIDTNGKIGAAVDESNGAVIDCTDTECIEFVASPDQDPSRRMEHSEAFDE